MDDPIAPRLLLQLILILLNALFAATEIAVISLNENKLRKQAEEGDKKAVKMLKMVTEPTGFLSAIQIGITLAGFLGSAFAADAFSGRLADVFIRHGVTRISRSALETISLIIVTLILSYITLVLGELFPKRIAMKKPEKVARAMCGLITGLSVGLKPLIGLLTVSTNGLLRLFGMDPKEEEEEVSEEEIMMMLHIGEEKGTIETEERELIENVFSLNGVGAEDVMVHRSCVTFLQAEDGREEVLKAIEETGFSRFPVYNEDEDDVLGILYVREYLMSLQTGGSEDLRDHLLPIRFVPESARINSILLDMKRNHIHMEVVVDEFGGVAGLITMEDILEELVGDIYDESDRVVEDLTELEPGKYRVLGSAELDDLCDVLDRDIDSEATTVGGWIVEQLGRIPKAGESMHLDRLTVEITEADARCIKGAILTVDPPAPEAEDG